MKPAHLPFLLSVLLVAAEGRAEPPPRSAAVAAARSEPEAEGAKLRRAGWLTLGAGTILAGGSAALYVIATNEGDDIWEYRDDNSRRNASVTSFRTHLFEAKMLALASFVAVGTGVTLLVIAPPAHELRVTAGLGQLALSGAF